MDLNIIERNTPKTLKIREGEIFLLPGRIPHSPQRYANTIGLVFERRRRSYEEDSLLWFAQNTKSTILYQEYFQCTDLGTQLKPIIERYGSMIFPLFNSTYSNSIVSIALFMFLSLVSGFIYQRNIELKSLEIVCNAQTHHPYR